MYACITVLLLLCNHCTLPDMPTKQRWSKFILLKNKIMILMHYGFIYLLVRDDGNRGVHSRCRHRNRTLRPARRKEREALTLASWNERRAAYLRERRWKWNVKVLILVRSSEYLCLVETTVKSGFHQSSAFWQINSAVCQSGSVTASIQQV